MLSENICHQAGDVTNQKQKETTQLLSNEDDLVLREQANTAAAFQMKLHLETEKVIMMDVSTYHTFTESWEHFLCCCGYR